MADPLPQNVHAVCNALRHIHNNVEIERQWNRAISGLKDMTNLERAQVWVLLSSHTQSMIGEKSSTLLSQYKALYKAAIKEISEPAACEIACCCAIAPDQTKMLEAYKKMLDRYQEFFQASTMLPYAEGEGVVQIANADKLPDVLAMQATISAIKDLLAGVVSTLASVHEKLRSQNSLSDSIIQLITAVRESNKAVEDQWNMNCDLRKILEQLQEHSRLSQSLDKLRSETKGFESQALITLNNLSDKYDEFNVTLDKLKSLQDDQETKIESLGKLICDISFAKDISQRPSHGQSTVIEDNVGPVQKTKEMFEN